MMEDSDPQPPENLSSEPPQLVPQRRPIRKRADPEATSGEGDDAAGFIAFLGSLYSQAKGEGVIPPVSGSGAAPERGPSVLQAKRLQRSGNAGAAGEAPSLDAGTRSEATTVSPAPLGVMKPRGTRPPRQGPWGRIFGWMLMLALLAAGAWAVWWWQGRPMAAEKTGAPEQTASGPAATPGEMTISDEALQVADQALDAIGKGDLPLAAKVLADAQSRKIELPGLRYQAALVAFRQGDSDQTEKWLDASTDRNEAVPECDYLRAATAFAKRDYLAATASLAEAARFAPFSPRYYFYWGEALRRQGKPAEAIRRFEQAMQCRPSAGDAELILFKCNLARIEAGNDAEFQKALAAQLTAETLPASTLLLGAANEINRSAYAAATPYLQKAAQALPPAVMQLRLRDYLFRLPEKENALAAEWAALIPTRPVDPAIPKEKAALVDPATRGLAETDPAIW